MGLTAAKPSVRVLSYEKALAAARQAFLEQSGLDMRSLAQTLAVGRATLYRVVRSREGLLGDVLWSLGEQTLHRAMSEATGDGVEQIIDTARRFNQYIVSFKPLRTFIRSEPMTAVHVLFTPKGGVHQRFIAAWEKIFREAEAAGDVVLPFEAGDLAHVWVGIGESILYSDLLTGRDPDIELAAITHRALLRAD